MAITKYDQFDFLIDIVPRDEIKPSKVREESSRGMSTDQVKFLESFLFYKTYGRIFMILMRRTYCEHRKSTGFWSLGHFRI